MWMMYPLNVPVVPEPVLVDEDEDPEEEEFEEEEERQEEEDYMEPEDVIKVEDTIESKDETVPASAHEVEGTLTLFFGRMASLSRRLCGHETAHALVEKKGKAKDEYYGKVATMGLETRFNELALICPRIVEPESVKVDAYIRGLTDNIKGEVTSSKPANMNEAVRMSHKLMEQKSQAKDERILEEKKQ
ncbi:hypothetical protein Tco_1574780, partial [Tanacetum coccineum]